jgi:hypothetical protein
VFRGRSSSWACSSLIVAAAFAAQAATVARPGFFVELSAAGGPGPAFLGLVRNLRAGFTREGIELVRGGERLRLEFLGAEAGVALVGEQSTGGRVSFLLGSDPRAWLTGRPAFGALRYRNLYPGVDLVYTSGAEGLKSEFVLAPGADPSAIRFRYAGAHAVRLDGGDLVVESAAGRLRERAPALYQRVNQVRVPVAGSFALHRDGSVGFAVGDYDRRRPLHIDPELQFSTFLGGSSLDYVTALAVDSAGRVIVAGWTDSTNFPTVNPFLSRGGGVDAFIVRYNAAGTGIDFATYLGGAGDDRAFGLAVDGSGQAVLTGYTTSTGFPVLAASQGTLAGGKDAFVAKLNAAGTGLVFSTYLGGSGQDEARSAAVDATGAIYVAGSTYSSNFPTLSAFQTMNAGGQDGFLAKFSAGGSRLYSTLLGGQADDRINAVAVDGAGQAYVTGGTSSANFPIAGAAQPALGGGQDAFVSKFSAGGTQLIYSTYLGGSGGGTGAPEEGSGIAVDAGGNAYVVGSTSSANFPVVNAYQASHRGGTMDAFLVKLNPTGSALLFSTYLGGGGADYGLAIALDANGIPHVAGQTNSWNFPTKDPLQAANAGLQDAFLAQLSPAGSALLWSSYLGGAQADGATAIGVDPSGTIHVAGVTQSSNFPLRNALQAAHAGLLDSFVARIRGYVPAAPQAVSVNPSSGSGTAVTFRATYSDENQVQDLDSVYVLVHTQVAQPNSCYVQYQRAQNALWLRNDAGTGWLGPATPGSAGTIENSQCTLAASSSAASGAGTTLTLDVALSFKPGFGGAKNVYLYAIDSMGANSGWQLRGTWSVSGFTPEALSVSPSSGAGSSQTFRFSFRDGDGYTQLQWVYALFNTSISATNACYLRYTRSDNTLWLRNDAGNAWTGPVTPGSTATLENSQCKLLAASSAASGSGVTLNVDVAIQFKVAFAGAKNTYLYAIDATNLISDWQLRGTWQVSGFPPDAVSVTPSSGSGNSQTFRFVFQDPDGFSDLQWVYALFHTSISGANGCYLRYTRAQNTLWLRNDAGNAWLGPVTPGTAGTVENSQCTLVAASSAASGSGTTLTLDVSVSFKGAFAGTKNVYLYAIDMLNLVSNWQQRGTWTIPGTAPEAVSVTPSSGSGSSQTFRFTFRDADGYTQLQWVYALFQTAINGANACYLRYTRPENTLWLRNDAGTGWLGPVTPGTAATVENTQCRLLAGSSAASGSSTILNVDVAIQFKTGFSGTKNIYLYAIDAMNLISDWQLRGSWTVP